jgi:hippurate hydrolase
MSINDVYEYLHQHPELSGVEYETTKFIKSLFNEDDFICHNLINTGLIFKTNTNYDEDVVFRCDIDGLKIVENTNVSFSSVNGNMHACGHDVHMTSIIKLMYEVMKYEVLNYNLVFVFQPSEEINGGAQVVIEDDFFKALNIKAMFASHVWPSLKLGEVGTRSGCLFGTNKVVKVVISGESTHTSTQNLGVNPLNAFNHIYSYLTTSFDKHDVFDPVVFNIGKIYGGEMVNSVMKELTFEMTIRAIDDDNMNCYYDKFINGVNAIDGLYGTDTVVDIIEVSYPCVVNDYTLLSELELVDYIELAHPTLAVEDFGFYTKLYPCVMFLIGSHVDEVMSLHSDKFIPSFDVVDNSVDLYLNLLIRLGVIDEIC